MSSERALSKISYLTNLKRFNISRFPETIIPESFSNLIKLEEFHLSCTNFVAEFRISSLKIIFKMNNIEKLSLNSNQTILIDHPFKEETQIK